MTKAELEKYRKIIKEIPILEMELADMKSTDSGLGNSVIMNYAMGFPKPESIVGFDQERYDKRATELKKKKEFTREVAEWIEGIEDAQTRVVFKYYYTNGMTWEQISGKFNCTLSPDYIRIKIRDKFMKEQKSS